MPPVTLDSSFSSDSVGDIAIVGIAARFPGGVGDPQSMWDLLAAGEDGQVQEGHREEAERARDTRRRPDRPAAPALPPP